MSTSPGEKTSTPYTQSDSQIVGKFLTTNIPKDYTSSSQIESIYSEHLSSFSSKIPTISSSSDEEITQSQSMSTQNLKNWWSMTEIASSKPSNEWNELKNSFQKFNR